MKNILTLLATATVLTGMLSGCGGGGGSSSPSSSSLQPQAVTGTVSAPGGTLPGATGHIASHVSSTVVSGVSGVTVTVGTVTVNSDGTATFTPITGATATTAADGSFSITLPAGTTVTGN